MKEEYENEVQLVKVKNPIELGILLSFGFIIGSILAGLIFGIILMFFGLSTFIG